MTRREEDEARPREGGMSAKDIARLDAEEMDEPKGETLRSPTPGGDPEHKDKRISDRGKTNSLTT